MFKPTLATLLLLSTASVASAQSAPMDLEVVSDEIIVTGRAQRLYRVNETTSGKLPTNPLNSTQIIATINEQLIKDQGARDAKDIYRNIAGVSVFSYAGVTARGFRQEEIFFDGLRGDPYVGFSVPQLFNVERVEFLKGPAGMLYGQGAPGGLFNYVTKKPERDFSAELRAIAGTEGRYGGSYEVTGPMGDVLASRLGVFYETRNTPRINTASETFILDAGVSVALHNDAELILQGTRYQQDLDGNRLRGVPVDDDGNFLTDRRWNHNESTDFLNLDSTNFQASLTGQTGEELNWDVTLRYTESRQEQNYHEPRALIDSDGDGAVDLVAREFRDQLREEEQISFGTNLTWSRDFGSASNRLLVGYEYFDSENTANLGGTRLSADFVTRFLGGQSLPGDIIPLYLDGSNYGQTNSGAYDVQFRPERSNEQSLHGLYGLNEITVGRFTAVGGLRYDDNSAGDDDNVSFRVGGIYKPKENVSIFLQYADSYSPISNGENVEEIGGPFDPVTGTILEGGVKASLFDGRLYGSVSVYDIVRDGILQATGAVNAGGENILADVGEVTSTGVEVEMSADITPDWVLTASYAYNDARITQRTTARGFSNSVGDRFANAPEHQLGFWTRYQVPSLKTAFAFGGDYVGEQLSFNAQTVQDYMVFDASIIFEPGPVKILLRVDNLLDKTYARSGFLERTGHFPGDPRSVFVEVSKSW